MLIFDFAGKMEHAAIPIFLGFRRHGTMDVEDVQFFMALPFVLKQSAAGWTQAAFHALRVYVCSRFFPDLAEIEDWAADTSEPGKHLFFTPARTIAGNKTKFSVKRSLRLIARKNGNNHDSKRF